VIGIKSVTGDSGLGIRDGVRIASLDCRHLLDLASGSAIGDRDLRGGSMNRDVVVIDDVAGSCPRPVLDPRSPIANPPFHTARIVIAAAAIAIACGWAAESRASGRPPATDVGCHADYVIGAEDVLDIAVWDNAALTRTVPVRPDGKISLPLLNDVQAAGLTPMQLRDKLSAGLTEYIPSPAVSVLVREVHSFKVTVIGQVKAAGRYEIKDRATVLDVLALAGGITEYAARGRIVVLRQDGATSRQIPVPYDRLTSRNAPKHDPAAAAPGNFCVNPGDVIVVPD
jgi:polysaccharide biosynthesis/export protein